MKKRVIYTLHETGAKSHFYALEEYAKNNGYSVEHREIHLRAAIRRFFFRFNPKLLVNIGFLLSLPFRPKTKVVMGIAPYNKRLPLLMRLLRRHEVYYFTSYTCWDQSTGQYPIGQKAALLEKWREFTTSFVKHIFAITDTTKQELVKNGFSTEDRISVVYHSYRPKIVPAVRNEKRLDFIQASRLISDKGIEELIEIFAKYPQCNLTIAGKGHLKYVVQAAAKRYPNIHYVGYVSRFNELSALYKSNSFFVLNSKRTGNWEEFFGLAIIEAMACGCLPLTSDHVGPKLIINDGEDGIIYKEEDLEQTIRQIIEMSDAEYLELHNSCVKRGEMFHCSQIAQRWSALEL